LNQNIRSSQWAESDKFHNTWLWLEREYIDADCKI